MNKIYLAGPYSDTDPEVRQERFEKLNDIAAALMHEGNIVFSPISHSHSIAVQCGLPLDFDFWEAQDRAFIGWCDKVVVVKLEGWEDSRGVLLESVIARQLGKSIEYLDV